MKTLENFALNASTQYINVNGVTYAYRRFGNKKDIPVMEPDIMILREVFGYP